jgi:glutathionyl-hydroquinone reductase
MLIDNKTLFAAGFANAIVGYTDDGKIVYSKSKMVESLIHQEDMSLIDAIEYCEFNIWNSYVGEFTPIYVNDFDTDFELIEEYNA